jgi:mRNA interferase MazF
LSRDPLDRGDDWIRCPGTSRPFGDRRAVAIRPQDLVTGALRLDSFVRPGKLFTASSRIVVGIVGRLAEGRRAEIVDALVRIVRGGA